VDVERKMDDDEKAGEEGYGRERRVKC